jgi:hypothetical protein
MNEKTRTVILILLSCLIFVFSVLSGMELSNRLENPEQCSYCHEMLPYYSSYQNPGNGSIMKTHKLNCIQCHASRNIHDAKMQVAIKIIAYNLNLSGVFKPEELEPNCTKCHSLPDTSIHKRTNLTDCSYCHWAHQPPEENSITSNLSKNLLIPYGPHRNQTCKQCHGTDVKIPRCVNCHEGHGGQKLENNLCIICHTDPHIPGIPGIRQNNTVNFTKDLSFSVCQPCHESEYSNLTNSTSHNNMQTCNICHNKHGKIPKCYNCHKAMKEERHLNNVKCIDCHTKDRLVKCEECHGRSHQWSAFTAIIPEESLIIPS